MEKRKPLNAVKISYHDKESREKKHGVIVTYMDEFGETQFDYIKDPTIKFKITDPDKWNDENNTHLHSYKKFVDAVDCIDVEVPFNNLLQSMFEIAQEYEGIDITPIVDSFETGYLSSYDALKEMHMLPFFHGTTRDIADEYMLRYKEEYDTNTQLNPKLAYFDIEVDSYKLPMFANEHDAVRPINAISYCGRINGQLTLLGLFSTEKTIEGYDESGNPIYMDNHELDRFMSDKSNLKKFGREYIKFMKDEGFENIKLKLEFFDSEVSMVAKFFEYLHADKPAFTEAWNHGFDLNTIINRLKRRGIQPKSIIVPETVPEEFRACYYIADTKSDKIEKKRDNWNIVANTNFTDQMMNFLKRRENLKVNSPLYSNVH